MGEGRDYDVEAVREAAAQLGLVSPAASAVVIDPRARRRVRTYDPATGAVVGEAGTDDVLRALLDREKLRAEELRVREQAEVRAAWEAVHERRRRGVADRCHECGVELSMKRRTVLDRDASRANGLPVFRCLPCNSRKRMASMTPEQRSEAARKAKAAMTPEQRSEAARKANAAMTPEQRSEAARKANATRWAEKEQSRAR